MHKKAFFFLAIRMNTRYYKNIIGILADLLFRYISASVLPGSGARFDDPEYSLNAILAQFNVSNDIKIEKEQESSEENKGDEGNADEDNNDETQKVEVVSETLTVAVPSGVTFKNKDGNVINSGRIFLKSETNDEQLKLVTAEMDKAMTDNGIATSAADKLSYYDVVLVDENGNKVAFEGGNLTICFAYPEGTGKDGFAFDVYHGLGGGKLEKLVPNLADKGIEVTVTSLSPFVIVSRPQAVSPATGNNTPVMVLLLAAVLAGGFAAFCFMRRRKTLKEQ